MKFKALIGIVAALSIAAMSSAASKDVEDLLSKMRSAYHAVRSATFTAESHFGESVFINSFTFQGPDKFHLEITAPGATDAKSMLVKISDGKTIAMKLPGSTEYTKEDYSLEAYTKNLPVNLETLAFFQPDLQLSTAAGKNMEHSELKILADQDWNGKKWTVLEEHATVGDSQKVVCQYFIDPKTSIIWRATVRGADQKDLNQDAILTKFDPKAKVTVDAFKIAG